MSGRAKFNIFLDKANQFLVIRPIGDLPGTEFVARAIEFYRTLEAPWDFDRIVDLRRYDGYLSTADLDYAASEWEQIATDIDYRLNVAMVVRYTKNIGFLKSRSGFPRRRSAILAITTRRSAGS